MNTQISDQISPNTFVTFVSVPQDGVKYRFENKTPYTIYLCDRSIASLLSAKSACFATVQAGQMHEFDGRFSAPFCVWINDTIDFAYSSAVDQTITLTTNLAGESSYVATLPIVSRSDDGGLDDQFVNVISASVGGLTLPTIDMSGYHSLFISWNIYDNAKFIRLDLYSSNDDATYDYVTSFAGQSSQSVTPKTGRYIRIIAFGFDTSGAVAVSVKLLVSRMKTPIAAFSKRIDPDFLNFTVPVSTLSTIFIPLKDGKNKITLKLTGATQTLVRINSNLNKYVFLAPNVYEEIEIDSLGEGVSSISIRTAEANARTFTALISNPHTINNSQNESTDVRWKYVGSVVLNNANPTLSIVSANDIGYDWALIQILGTGIGAARSVTVTDVNNHGNTHNMLLTAYVAAGFSPVQSAMFRLDPKLGNGINFSFAAGVVPPGAETNICRLTVIKGNKIPSILFVSN